MLPTFVTMGAMKCGTTSFHAYLAGHPDLFMSGPKELDFFSNDAIYRSGREWYEAQFETDRRHRGETSPNYTKRHLFPAAADRMFQLLPHCSLIYLVRHPVERFVSHYIHAVAAGHERRSLADVIRSGDANFLNLLNTGRYAYQLEPYLERYGAGRILVVRSEDLESNPVQTLTHCHTFLGVAPTNHAAETPRKLHTSGGKRMPRPWAQTASALGSFSQKLISRLPRPLTTSPMPPATLSNEDRKRLEEVYRPDTAKLERLTARSMGWFQNSART